MPGLVMSTFASLLRVAPLVWVSTVTASGGDGPATAAIFASGAANFVDSIPEGLAASDWSSIRAAYEAGRHRLFSVDDACRAEKRWSADNPGQGLNTTFDERGFTTQPDATSWSWGLELRGYGWDITTFVDAPCATSTDGDRLARVWDERLTEWHVNDARGLEHDFTVASRPSSAKAPLSVELSIRGGLQPVVSPDGRSVAFTDAQGSTTLNYSGLTVFDNDGKTVPAKWCSTGNNRLRLQVDDAAAHYPLTIDPIVQQPYPWSKA
jgi:hypothetical protein